MTAAALLLTTYQIAGAASPRLTLSNANPMKTLRVISTLTGTLLVLSATGCKSDYGAGNPYQPGPTAGKAVGAGVGTVAGNVVGAGVGVVQGITIPEARFEQYMREVDFIRKWVRTTSPLRASAQTLTISLE